MSTIPVRPPRANFSPAVSLAKRSFMSKKLGVRVGDVPYGRGVFATQSFSKGELVSVVEGQVIDDADYSSDYCMDLGGTLSLEPGSPRRHHL
jgi:hypothetical protein